jgi:hypothetical protein
MTADASHPYDIALSFAGEDRPTAEACARQLKVVGYRVFYDLWEQHDLLGKDLVVHLDRVYGTAARYCVVFISKHYVEKAWTRHELRSAQARALQAHSEYILPLRLDDTPVPGMPSTIGHLDLRKLSMEDVVQVLIKKLGPRQSDDQISTDLASSDPQERVRALSRVAIARDLRWFDRVASLVDDTSPEVRGRAVLALDNIGDSRAKNLFIAALADPDWFVRSNAGWGLVHLGKQVELEVEEVAAKSESQAAREMARLVLERL